MNRQLAQRSVDALIARLAAEQHGVVASWQLRDAGVGRGVIDFRLAGGRLHPLHRGVYALARSPSPAGRRMAAVLALGPAAVLSHRSAAEHRGLLDPVFGAAHHVTVPGRGGRSRRRGIRVHRAPAVEAERHDGIPTTPLARTLLDVAATESTSTLDRAIAAAERARVFDLRTIAPLLESGRPGVAALRRAVEVFDGAPTASELERRFLALCRRHRIPRPLVNVLVEGHRVDFFWPTARLIVETDGATHDGARARERDRARDLAHGVAGCLTERFTWRQVLHDDERVARLVLRRLAERSSR